MNNRNWPAKAFYFPLTRMVIGLLPVLASVLLGELVKNELGGSGPHPGTEFLLSVVQVMLVLATYVLIFSWYEKRQVTELGLSCFFRDGLTGFASGLAIQSLSVLVLFWSGGYRIVSVNPLSFLLPGLTFALVAGFVGEIVLRGVAFRLLEELLGTAIALGGFVLLFALMHLRQPGATLLSVLSIAIQGGLLLSASYVFARNLWVPIFLHFAWDLAEPGIFGGSNPGTSLDRSLFHSTSGGPGILSGGQFGPGNSLQATLFCLALSGWFLWKARRRNHILPPAWKR